MKFVIIFSIHDKIAAVLMMARISLIHKGMLDYNFLTDHMLCRNILSQTIEFISITSKYINIGMELKQIYAGAKSA